MALHFEFTVAEAENGDVLRHVLRRRFRFSRRLFTKLKQTSAVTVNGCSVYLTARVKSGDSVKIKLLEETDISVQPEPIPLDIVCEDEDLLVINKQPGIVVHPTKDYPNGTLANGLIHYWQERGEAYRVRPVNRLDKETSGVVVFAKHAYAHDFLVRQMKRGAFERAYRAIVAGALKLKWGTVDMPIGRDPKQPSHRTIRADGKRAVTHYTVLRRLRGATYLKCRLETGRTHQIRVHMQAIGHPVVGDAMYGDTGPNEYLAVARQALHAHTVGFIHPRTRKRVCYTAPLPEDMKQLIKRLSR